MNEDQLSDRDLWNLKRSEGMSPSAATAYVESRRLNRPEPTYIAQDSLPPVTARAERPRRGGLISDINQAAARVAQGGTFGLADEAAAAISGAASAVGPGTFREGYDRSLSEQRAEREDFAADHPVVGFVSELAGGVATGGAAGRAAGTLARRGAAPVAGWLGNTARNIVGSTASGAVAGAGAAEPGERLEGAIIGAATGGAFGTAASGLGAVGTTAANFVKRPAGNVPMATPPGPVAAGAGRLASALGVRDAATVADDKLVRAIDQSGVPYDELRRRVTSNPEVPQTISDLTARRPNRPAAASFSDPEWAGGPQVASIAQLAGNYPSAGQGLLQDASLTRTELRPGRILESLKRTTGIEPPGSLVFAAEEMAEQRAAASAPLYAEAFAAGNVSSPTIDSMLRDSQIFQKAWKTAEQMAIVKGVRIPSLETVQGQLMEGTGGIYPVQAVDWLKKGLDAVIDQRGSSDVPISRESARDLRDVLNRGILEVDTMLGGGRPEASPYKIARDTWGGDREMQEALELGGKLMDSSLSADDIALEMSRLDPSTRDFFRMGAVASVRGALGDARGQGNPVGAVNVQVPEIGQKIRLLFDNDGDFQRFAQSVGLEGIGQATDRAMLTGSRTAPMAATAAEIFDTNVSAAGNLATGDLRGAARNLVQGGVVNRLRGYNSNVASGLSNRLSVGATGDDRQRLMMELLDELEEHRRRMGVRQAASTGRISGAASVAGGTLTGNP